MDIKQASADCTCPRCQDIRERAAQLLKQLSLPHKLPPVKPSKWGWNPKTGIITKDGFSCAGDADALIRLIEQANSVLSAKELHNRRVACGCDICQSKAESL